MKIPAWLVRLSIFVNDITGGPKGWSICARLYAGKLEGKRLHTVLVKVTDRIFWFDPGHCRKAWLLRATH